MFLESYVDSKSHGPAGSGGIRKMRDGIVPVSEAPDGVDVQDAEDVSYAAAEFDIWYGERFECGLTS